MTISSCRIFRYRLPLVGPLPLAGGVIHEREGLLVRLESDSGAWGWGDAAPLPRFSREGIDEAAAEAMAWAGSLRDGHFEPRDDGLESWPEWASAAVSPSVRFGLETALSNLVRRMEDGAAAELAGFDGSVPVNGLLAGSREQVLADARRLRDGGCRAVKLKVGSRAVAEDVELTRAVREVLGDSVGLRLDANRSWSLEQAVAFGRDMGSAGIEYLEEPLREAARLRELFDATGIPVALDESLLELRPEELEGRREVGAVVLKPTLLGGLARAKEWAVRATALNISPVVSSCFESGVGLLALAEFAWDFTRDSVPAGLDTYRWLGADVVAPRISFRPGAFEWDNATARAHRIDRSRLSEIRHD
ncbi:MAG: o-succinylbenzoate synthase [Deltaproteobacteria bacterium]|nr:o-succinylbenzoate synthase [Deltaproteobacteria bacterium]